MDSLLTTMEDAGEIATLEIEKTEGEKGFKPTMYVALLKTEN